MPRTKIMLSLDPADLAAIDELAYKARKNRSVFLVDKALDRDKLKPVPRALVPRGEVAPRFKKGAKP